MINRINYYVGDVVEIPSGGITFIDKITLTEAREYDCILPNNVQAELLCRKTIFDFIPRYDRYAGELCRNCRLRDFYTEEDCKRFCKFFNNPSFPEHKIYLPGDEVFHILTRTVRVIESVGLCRRSKIRSQSWASSTTLGGLFVDLSPLLIFSEQSCAFPEEVRIRKRNSILSLHKEDTADIESEICSGCIYNDGWCYDCPIKKLKSR